MKLSAKRITDSASGMLLAMFFGFAVAVNIQACRGQDVASHVRSLQLAAPRSPDRLSSADYLERYLRNVDLSAAKHARSVQMATDFAPLRASLVAVARSTEHSDHESFIALRALSAIGELPPSESVEVVEIVLRSELSMSRRLAAIETLMYTTPDDTSVAKMCFQVIREFATTSESVINTVDSSTVFADARLTAPLVVSIMISSGHTDSELSFLLDPERFAMIPRDVQQLVVECVKLMGAEAEPSLDELLLITDSTSDTSLKMDVAIAIFHVSPSESMAGILLDKLGLPEKERTKLQVLFDSLLRAYELDIEERSQIGELDGDQIEYFRDALLHRSESARRQIIRDIASMPRATELLLPEIERVRESGSERTIELLSRLHLSRR